MERARSASCSTATLSSGLSAQTASYRIAQHGNQFAQALVPWRQRMYCCGCAGPLGNKYEIWFPLVGARLPQSVTPRSVVAVRGKALSNPRLASLRIPGDA
jgi:hypothetical protein